MEEKRIEQKKNEIKNIKQNIQESDFCQCWIKFFNFIKSKYKYCNTNCSILNQFLFYILPISHLIAIGLIIGHIFLFDNILKYDYYTVVKEEFLRYLITDIDDAHYELSTNEIKSQFEDIGNILFFKLYYGELISLGLLDGENIFPNISDVTENFYQFVDRAFEIDKSSSSFFIPSNLSKKYIDEREDSLSELVKIYYYFYPLLSFEAYSIQTYVNQTFLIAYKVQNDSNDIRGKEMYFNFPRINDDFLENNNFHAYNNFISPKINSSLSQFSNINNSYQFENWFIKQDSIFRKYSNELYDINLNFHHLNTNHEGIINKTNVISMQTYYKNKKGEKFIINIIYFIWQKKLEIGSFDHSVFIISNNSDIIPNIKFSDNETFVISQNDITEISLSQIIHDYFHYGLKANNYNFYYKGIFYDNIDLNLFSEPTEYYSTIKGFNLDIRYFSPFYLYSKLVQRSSFIKNYSEDAYIYTYYFNESWHIKDICSKYNFSLYKNYLTLNNIECLNKKNLLYYYKNKTYNSVGEDVSLPYCICLPLYCIKDLESNYENNNFEIVDEITLPEKCQNNLQFYENDINEQNLKKEVLIDSSKLKIRDGKNLNEQLENQFIKFIYVKLNLLGGLSFILISIVDNTSLKSILTNLINNLNKMKLVFIFVISSGLSILIIGIYVLILINIYKISKSITEFKEKIKEFIEKIQNKMINSENKKNDINNNKNDDFIFNDKSVPENLPLLEYDSLESKFDNNIKDSLNNEENTLINDLFLIYCHFYRLSEENIAKDFQENKEGSKTQMKIKTLTNNNELFKLFCLITLYTPRFRLDINIDFNIYKDSKLMNNYMKCIAKKSSSNIDKEQILYTKSILYELLSTEFINDYGFITNLNFNYLTNINLDNKNKINPIQKAIFKQVEDIEKKDKKNREKLYTEDDENPTFKLVWKNKNLIMKNIEEKFEQDDYLQLNKLESSFNSSLINAYYNYLNKIIILKEKNS